MPNTHTPPIHHQALGTQKEVKLMILYKKWLDLRSDVGPIIMQILHVLFTLSVRLLE